VTVHVSEVDEIVDPIDDPGDFDAEFETTENLEMLKNALEKEADDIYWLISELDEWLTDADERITEIDAELFERSERKEASEFEPAATEQVAP
jgi:hypothetical protein